MDAVDVANGYAVDDVCIVNRLASGNDFVACLVMAVVVFVDG